MCVTHAFRVGVEVSAQQCAIPRAAETANPLTRYI